MICRGGVVVGGARDAIKLAPLMGDDAAAAQTSGRVRWPVVSALTIAATAIFAWISWRAAIPPLVESDYCYLLVAADRFLAGQGLTTTPPVAPFQPWEWQADWAFLTKWPCGFPLLIAAIRWVSGMSSIEACRLLSALACGAGVVGWFLWIRRCVPRGLCGVLLGVVAAGCAMTPALLIHPTTDVIVVAAVPFVCLLTLRGLSLGMPCANLSQSPLGKWGIREAPMGPETTQSFRLACLACAGLLAGALFWIRYASLFLPIAIGVFLVAQRLWYRRVCLRSITVYSLCASIPVVALLAINRAYGIAESAQAQLNLGATLQPEFSWSLLVEVWRNFTRFSFYHYHAWVPMVLTLWPLAAVAIVVLVRPVREVVREFLRNPAILLSLSVVAMLLVMLVTATAIFGQKFHYVGLARYYLPIKPLYFALFAAPVLLIDKRLIRALLCTALLVACLWIAGQDWSATLHRWAESDVEGTRYGQRARCFAPHADRVYDWIDRQNRSDLVIVSNYHEYIALETQVPALPIPPDRKSLDAWIARIGQARGVSRLQTIFVLDRQHGWRNEGFADSTNAVERFGLVPFHEAPSSLSARVFQYASDAALVSESHAH